MYCDGGVVTGQGTGQEEGGLDRVGRGGKKRDGTVGGGTEKKQWEDERMGG